MVDSGEHKCRYGRLRSETLGRCAIWVLSRHANENALDLGVAKCMFEDVVGKQGFPDNM
jgi:hypothetical protein